MCPPPPTLSLCATPDAHIIFLHDELLCDGTCSLTEGGGGVHKELGAEGSRGKNSKNDLYCSKLSGVKKK